MESEDDDDGGNTDNDEAEGDDDDDDRHTRMLQSLTGMPSAAFEGIVIVKRLKLSSSMTFPCICCFIAYITYLFFLFFR